MFKGYRHTCLNVLGPVTVPNFVMHHTNNHVVLGHMVASGVKENKGISSELQIVSRFCLYYGEIPQRNFFFFGQSVVFLLVSIVKLSTLFM